MGGGGAGRGILSARGQCWQLNSGMTGSEDLLDQPFAVPGEGTRRGRVEDGIASCPGRAEGFRQLLITAADLWVSACCIDESGYSRWEVRTHY